MLQILIDILTPIFEGMGVSPTDIMLGFGSNVRTDIENLDSPTMVKALRQASKNILFTVVRSGNYTMEQESSGLDRMTAMFIGIDAAVGIAVAGTAAFLFLRYRKKNQRG